jgi:predicted DNA binding protein
MATKGSCVAVRIRLSDGSAFVVDSDFEDLHKRVLSAIKDELPLLEVRNGNGKMRSINPQQIVTIEEADEDELTPKEEQILQSARHPQPQTD